VDDSELKVVIDDAGARAEVGAVALVDAVLERIEATNGSINAYLAVRAEAAREEARAVDDRRARGEALGPLAGLPMAIKDNIDVAGIPTTAGAVVLPDRVPTADAEVVRRLRDAGAIVVGKTALHELAYGVITDNPHFGATRNPWDPSRIAGGSSGGSGAALAADACVLALGTDTGGSVRIPAALNGVSGLRPTFGAVSVRGSVPLSPSLDTVGPMARSLADVGALLSALGGYDAADPWSAPGTLEPAASHAPRGLAGIRVGLPPDHFYADLERDVERHVRAAVAVLADLGADVREIALPGTAAAIEAMSVLIRSEALSQHQERLDAEPERFGDDVRRRLELGRSITGVQLARAIAGAREWQLTVARAFDDVDVIVTPTTAATAPPIEGLELLATTAQLTRFTYPWSIAGIPAVSVPCGFDSLGLPVGLQIAAAAWRDATALHVGTAYQSVTGWHRERPALVTPAGVGR
jgi:aspartyl-tRNA(Asn)/glutamyl-tRNA(Gln) amidotransferase subunit A